MDLIASLPGHAYPLRRAAHLTDHLIWMRLDGRADATLLARRRAVVRLAEHLGHDPVDAGYAALEDWQRTLLRRSLGHVRSQTSLVRPYYAWLHERGHRPDNPAARLPCPAKPRGVPRPMAEDRVDAVVAGAHGRLLSWLLLAGWSGLRACEIAPLRVENFLLGTGGRVWVVLRGKGGHVRNVPVHELAWPEIAAGLPEHGPAWRRLRGFGPVTALHVSQACNDHLHRNGVPDTFHSLRHRFATLTYEQTGDIRLVQQLCGHASSVTTEVYTRVQSHRMAAAVNALPAPPLPPRPRHLHAVDDTTGGTA